MASILDSFRETFSDRMALLKLIVFAIPVYYSYVLFLKSAQNPALFMWVFIFTIMLLFGFLIKTTSGVLNEAMTVMPSLNPFSLLFAAIKGLLAVGPAAFVSIWLANFVIPKINIIPWLDITLISVIWLVVIAIILTTFLMFVKRERILDAYNLKTLSDKSGDLMVGVIFFILQLVVINLPTTGFLAYTLIVLFGVGPVLYFFLAMALVFNIGVTGHYMAQLQYEVLGFDKNSY